jgi:uncharacterized protein involved in exopolysaccharide biosynthesis
MNPENVINDKDNFEEISLKELLLKIREWWRFLMSKWVIILAFGIIGGILGFVYAFFKKPIYTATTTFVLESGDGSGLGQYAGLASMAGIDIGGGGGGIFQGDNILELYKSRTMIEKTLLSKVKVNDKKELLIDQFIAFNKLRESWDKNEDLKNINFDLNQKGFTRLQDSILGVIVQDINLNYLNVAKADKKLSIIKVDVKAKDELFAKLFNEQIVKNVNDFYTQTKTKKSLENVIILEQKTDSVRAVMNGAIYSAAAVADATPNLNPTRQIQRVAPVQRSQFTLETNKIVLGELVKNLELGRLSLRKEMPLIQVIDIPVFPLEKKKLGKAKGIVLGGFLFGFLTVLFLFLRKLISDVVKN